MTRRLNAAGLGAVVAAAVAGCGLLRVSAPVPADGWPPPAVAATFDGHSWRPAKPAAMPPYRGAGRWNTEFPLIACPAARACFAAGSAVSRADGRIVTGLAARLGPGGHWTAAERLPGDPDQPGTLSCASVSLCVAAGPAATYVLNGKVWRRGPAFPGNASRTAACAAPDFCVEVQPTAYRYETFHHGSWTAPRFIPPLPGTNLLPNLLTCATPSFCLGMADGYAYWIFDGTRWTPGRRTGLPPGGPHGLDPAALSCASPRWCAAVGSDVLGYAMASVYNGSTWSTPAPVVQRRGYTRLTSVSCPAPRFCAAVGTWSRPAREFAVTLGADRWSSPAPLANTQGDPSVACAAATYCTALTGEVRS